jgi:hypothetical protein
MILIALIVVFVLFAVVGAGTGCTCRRYGVGRQHCPTHGHRRNQRARRQSSDRPTWMNSGPYSR